MNDFWITVLCVTFALVRPSNAAADFRTPPPKRQSISPNEFISTHSSHVLSRDFILSFYNNLTKGYSMNHAAGRPKHWQEVNFADTVRIFPAIASHELRQQLVYRFNVSQIGSRERLRVAELRVKLPSSWDFRQHFNLVAVASKGNALIYASSIPISTTHQGANQYRIIDVTSAVHDWMEFAHFRKLESDTSLDLAFSVDSRRKAMTRSKFLRQLERFYRDEMTSEDSHVATPSSDVILVTYTQSGGFLGSAAPSRSSRNATVDPDDADVTDDANTTRPADVLDAMGRSRRSARRLVSAVGDRRLNSANGHSSNPARCRRRDLEIDFPALGWGEWVVYPTMFNAFQCTGKCGGFSDSQHNPTNHAIVQSLVKLVSRTDIPMSCCTATKLSPLSILYLEKGSVVIKHHEEMIVDECGCM